MDDDDLQKQITIKSRLMSLKDKKWVEIQVSDTGIGIAHENLSSLFKFGYTTKGEEGEKGFSLHSSRNFVQAQNGSLEACSDGVGKGALFTIKLPTLTHKDNRSDKLIEKMIFNKKVDEPEPETS